MQLGMIGLGRMGANMVRRLLKGGHQCVVFDRTSKTVKELVQEKAAGTINQTARGFCIFSTKSASDEDPTAFS